MNLIKLTVAVFAAIIVTACGPVRHAVRLEMRYPSSSGVDIGGKTVSVAYLSGVNGIDEKINFQMADAFAKGLEKDIAIGKENVGLFVLEQNGGNYASRDSLLAFLMKTGSDMVFLLDAGETGRSAVGRSIEVSLYCYDGMDRQDKVKIFKADAVLGSGSDAKIVSEAADVGRRLSESFVSQWKNEQFSILYFEGQRWYDALLKAEQYDWKGAMDIWFTLLDTSDPLRRSCAEYNIAVACFLLGDAELAAEWLDRSDRDNKIQTLSDILHKRINSRL